MENKRKITLKKACLGCILASMLATSLTGCGKKFSYVTKEDGSIETQGNVSYNYLKKCLFIQINYTDGTKTYYIAKNKIAYDYYDISTGKEVLSYSYSPYDNSYVTSHISIASFNYISIEDVLIKYNFIKEEYSVDDTDTLYNMCVKEFEQDENKKYVKEIKFDKDN